MAEKTKCEICDRNFKDKEGLDMHNSAKHPKPEKKPSKINYKKIRNWSIFILIIGLILFWAFTSVDKSLQANAKLNFEPPRGAIHWHPQLSIIINGLRQTIPSNIGISSGGHSPIHTHDADGTLHMENSNPTKRSVTLGYFFDIWGKEFSKQCIFDYCTDKGNLTMSVNGKENFDFENYFIQDKDKIVINYTFSIN